MATASEARSTGQNKSTIFAGEKERRRRFFVERTAFGLTVFACFLLIFLVWYTNGKVLEPAIQYLSMVEGDKATASRNRAQNCMDPKNKNTPYCQERTAQTEEDWKGMSRTQGGKTTQFTLHGKW